MAAARARKEFDAQAKERQGTRTDIKETLPESNGGQSRDQAGAAFGVSGKPGKKRPPAAMMAKVTDHLWSSDELYNTVLYYG